MVKGLKNKVVLVTGAAQGIGRGIALRLAQEGAHIALVDMKQDRLNDVQQEIQALGVNASTFIADVSDSEQVYAVINHAEQTLGGFDVMINNAGIAQVQAIADVTPDEFQKIVDINIGGVLWGIQAAATKFKQRQHKGKIINACSIAGRAWRCQRRVGDTRCFPALGNRQRPISRYHGGTASPSGAAPAGHHSLPDGLAPYTEFGCLVDGAGPLIASGRPQRRGSGGAAARAQLLA